MNRILFSVILALVLLVLLPDLVSACPNCKEAYLADGQSPVASGFNESIYFLMVMPFFVLGAFTLRLWLAMRRRDTVVDDA
ncbi:MAG: hypothetical protein RBU27_09745 [Bacteroidota bacterium]|jgi:hypothetical protein|nr:hypothetical protein [Bacteroidota bacterium]